jgi:UTP--glucose-1-phosphate uridylyltransferase
MSESHALILQKSLASLSGEVQRLLEDHRFSHEWLLRQVELSKSGTRKNQVNGQVTPLLDDDMTTTPEPGSDAYEHYRALGEAALRNGECALAVLAGGMATRMGGVIKALVPAAHEKTFLELRLSEQRSLAEKYGRTPPLWLMTSYATHQGIEEALGNRLKASELALFRQGLSVRLDENGEVFRESSGEPSLYSPGHGDFVECLQNSGLLERFISQGGKYVLATNLDNLGGGLDPVIIGMHLASECAVTCEVVDKDDGDRGGIPARLDGKPVILEEFRLPETFDPTLVSVFNVNTFAFDAHQLSSLSMDFTYFEVKKQVEGKAAIQYERLINEVTFHLPTQYARVPRSGTASRFLPVKDYEELARRQADLDALAIARGMVAPQ